jgi:hypothetical protein
MPRRRNLELKKKTEEKGKHGSNILSLRSTSQPLQPRINQRAIWSNQ